MAAERHLRLRDWPPATTPAQADLLVRRRAPMRLPVHGGGTALQDLPAPRARAHVLHPPTEHWLPSTPPCCSPRRQRSESRNPRPSSRPPQDRRREQSSDEEGTGRRSAFPEEAAKDGEHGEEPSPDRSNGKYTGSAGHSSLKQHHGDHGGEDKRGDGGDAHEDHQGHGGHGGHGGMEMPGGLPMAGQGEDRDGLTLDRLHVPLGPLLSDWPTGLRSSSPRPAR